MYRGTTPTHRCTLPNIDTEKISAIFITYSRCDRVVVEKDIDDISFNGNIASVTLTQKDTLKFIPVDAFIQIRIKLIDNTTLASNIKCLPIERILKDGEI